MRRFLRDEQGAATVEYVIIFVPLIMLIFLIFQVAIAYHWALSAQKGLELAARTAAISAPVHEDLQLDGPFGITAINRAVSSGSDSGDPCWVVLGTETVTDADGNSVTVDRTACEYVPTYTCRGINITEGMDPDEAVPPGCSYSHFKRIFDEVDRFAYQIDTGDLAIQYQDVGLGNAGQPYVPLIVLAIDPQSMPIVLRLFDSTLEFQIPSILTTIVAEDLSG
ncbi:TadE/TadG family type IV pilus assembly protein [Roseobacter sp. HKCCA0434]|uniref:TadE/TadG family type IV pilus assembly protein n=1 Tax=Roseobacter sp. HKCCA0434 TaxID=3079297 RepID=UPI002905A73C|nr:TadE/TadG family type IV pilus assembly protein [Roseobacter sp. HKCCA0434]